MNTPYILFGVAAVFVIAAIVRLKRDQGRLSIQSRTWLLIAGIFAAVGIWLITR